MSSSRRVRANLTGAGSYVSIAAALGEADEGVRHVLKTGFTAESPNDAANPDELETRFVTDHALVDFASLDTRSGCRKDHQGL